MKNYHLYILTFLMTLWAISVKSQDNRISLDSLKMDSTIRYGRLDNGFTYYLKHLNDAPKTEMKLMVKAGTFNQTNEQSIAAHLIEHLPFRFTSDFPGINIRLNPKFKKYNINNLYGQTIMTHTAYNITLPKAANFEGISTALLWYQNIGNMKISNYDIEKEARILGQEGIYRSGNLIDWILSNKRREAKIFPCATDLSNFFNAVETISPRQVEEFYNKWYRPDRMGLIITGNIQNLTSLESKIKSIFSKLPIPDSSNPTSGCIESYLNGERRFAIVEKQQSGWINKSNPSVEVFLNFRKKDPLLTAKYSVEALRHSIIWKVVESLINNRSNAQGINYILVNQRKREMPFLQISLEDRKGMEKNKIQKTIRLLSQINTFGITTDEWNVIQNNMLKKYTFETSKNSISYWVTQIRNHFLYHEILPYNKQAVIKAIIQSMTVNDINKYISDNFKPIPDDISMLVPKDNKALTYTEIEVRNWISQALEKPIKKFDTPTQNNFEFTKVNDHLELSEFGFDKLPLASISKMENDQNTKTEIITLGNGIRVILDKRNQNQTKDEYVEIHGFNPVGAKCFHNEKYFSAINAPSLIKNKTNIGEINTYVNNFTSGIKALGNISDIESLFQSIYYNFRFILSPTTEDINRFKEISNQQYFYPNFDMASNDFIEFKQTFLGSYNTTPRATKRFYGIKKTDPREAYNIYKILFGNASNYTFIIRGNFTNSQIIPLLRRYFGNLPIQENSLLYNCKEAESMIKSVLPTAPVHKVFYLEDIKPFYNLKNVHYEISYRIRNNEDFWNWKERVKLLILSKAIQNRLYNLRYEKKAALYGNNYSYIDFNPTFRSTSISIYLACLQEELDWLRRECENIIAEIKGFSLEQNEFEEIINNEILPYFTSGNPDKKPTSNEIFEYLRYGAPVINKLGQDKFIRSLTQDDIRETARKFFQSTNQFEFIMKNTRDQNNPK